MNVAYFELKSGRVSNYLSKPLNSIFLTFESSFKLLLFLLGVEKSRVLTHLFGIFNEGCLNVAAFLLVKK